MAGIADEKRPVLGAKACPPRTEERCSVRPDRLCKSGGIKVAAKDHMWACRRQQGGRVMLLYTLGARRFQG
jgi:hypothetical protein